MSAGVRRDLPGVAVAALALFLVSVGTGYDVLRWAPIGVVLVALLAVRLIADPPAWRALPPAVPLAAAALAAYTAWSALSITWAGDRGIAWEGANRTLLYLAAFCVLALWPLTARAGAAVIGLWTGGIIVFGVVELVRLATDADPRGLFYDGRLLHPGGYYNATAAMWLMAAWPAFVLAARRGVVWPARALLGGGALVLLDLALLSQSRGTLIATPITALVALAVVPGRVRTFAALLVLAAALAPTVPVILDVRDAVVGDGPAVAAVHAAVRATALAAGAAAIAFGLWGLAEARRPLGATAERRVHRAGVVVAVLAAAVAVVGGAVAAGDPGARARSAWASFKGGYATDVSGSRLTSGLGSGRYDYYRVALDVAREHPLRGIGADNFGAAYLRQGRTSETPRYTHSVPLRTLVGTGAVGLALLLAFAAACLVAAVRALRAGGLRAGAAAGALLAAAYWAVHGSADWFWEIAGLGIGAFAALGAACALAPPRSVEGVRRTGRAWVLGERAAVVVAALAAVVSLALPALAERDVRDAGAEFARNPGDALARLQRASRLDRLTDRPLLVSGGAWIRLSDLGRADASFRAALERRSDGSYALLERGVIASAQGRRSQALTLLSAARRADPRNPIVRSAQVVIRRGRRVDPQAVERALAAATRLLQGG